MPAGEYDDGSLGEVFIKMSKQGSTLAGVMDAFSVSISIGLQYGVPLEAFVSKYIKHALRFDPAGTTDDADIRIAQSVMDYLFRRLALDYLPMSTRTELGVFSAERRAAAVATGSYSGSSDSPSDLDVEGLAQGIPVRRGPLRLPLSPRRRLRWARSTELLEAMQGIGADAPLCMTCGTKMRPAGSCYVRGLNGACRLRSNGTVPRLIWRQR